MPKLNWPDRALPAAGGIGQPAVWLAPNEGFYRRQTYLHYGRKFVLIRVISVSSELTNAKKLTLISRICTNWRNRERERERGERRGKIGEDFDHALHGFDGRVPGRSRATEPSPVGPFHAP